MNAAVASVASVQPSRSATKASGQPPLESRVLVAQALITPQCLPGAQLLVPPPGIVEQEGQARAAVLAVRGYLDEQPPPGPLVGLRWHRFPAQAVEEALCFGWVDSLPRRLSGSQAMLYVAPRKPTSAWSRANKERVERLTAAGRVQPAGLPWSNRTTSVQHWKPPRRDGRPGMAARASPREQF